VFVSGTLASRIWAGRVGLPARHPMDRGTSNRQALRLPCLGLLLGAGLGQGLAKTLASVLVVAVALDVPSFLAATAVLAMATVAAALLPARRVLVVDPAQTLRSE